MGNKLYVGNLSFSVDSSQLTELFSQFGKVSSSNVILDRDTGRSKGFAFIEMSAASEAQDVIEKLNGQDLSGRAMRISEAKPQETHRSSGSNRIGGFGSRRSF